MPNYDQLNQHNFKNKGLLIGIMAVDSARIMDRNESKMALNPL